MWSVATKSLVSTCKNGHTDMVRVAAMPDTCVLGFNWVNDGAVLSQDDASSTMYRREHFRTCTSAIWRSR